MSNPTFSFIPPEELKNLLEFVDPVTGNFTCVGHAPSRGRRCHNPIAYHNQKAAKNLLSTLPQLPDQRHVLLPQLEEIARLALCKRNHQGQDRDMAARWQRILVREFDRRQQPPVAVSNPTVQSIPTGPDIADVLVMLAEAQRELMLLRAATNNLANIPPAPTQSTESRAASAASPNPRADLSVGNQNASSEMESRGLLNPPLTPVSLSDSIAESRIISQSSDTASSGENIETGNNTGSDHDSPCAICQGPYEDPYQTPCGHVYCHECITTWLGHQSSCPQDRRPLYIDELVPFPQEEEETCAICYEESDELQVTPCGHVFCRGCISTWLATNRTCPYDRRPLFIEDMLPLP